ncbi:hypothetical protein TIFTF001_032530 [Ficus carica]|uniref:Uncharacterized protein n=1 Tax=Ficus carica TaxID=3494 RepID=A0AA88DXC7_FICCA|nr:hypothetical protein TIFTF001_032530 [Ficus carica]
MLRKNPNLSGQCTTTNNQICYNPAAYAIVNLDLPLQRHYRRTTTTASKSFTKLFNGVPSRHGSNFPSPRRRELVRLP